MHKRPTVLTRGAAALVDIVETSAEAARLDPPPLIVRERLADVLPGEGAVELRRLGEGHSNVTFLVSRGDDEWVLRRPPRPPYARGAHDVIREYRILERLQAVGVRVPRPFHACEDAEVIGAPFYLMERVNGLVIRDELPSALEGGEAREAVAGELVDALVELHAVDPADAKLPVRSNGDGYLARQLALWHGQWTAAEDARDVPGVLELADRLKYTMPASPPATVVHGDYKLDNVIFDPERPPRLHAILDWEMATVGDPLSDLGFLTATWVEPGEPADRLLGLSQATAEPGFPTRAWLADRYAAGSPLQLDRLPWYQALALWKLAILLEGSYRRFLAGTDDDPFFERLKDGVPALATLALEFLRDDLPPA